jgi:hypothetical protein
MNRRCFYPLILVFLPLSLLAADTVSDASKAVATDPGYSMLRLFLVDEHYLTAIRRVKSILSFGGISPGTADLVDEIADSSETALRQLDSLASEPPAVQFDAFDEANIAITTFDALRYDMARQLFLDSEHFEKNLLLSQVQVLPVITHLTKQLAANETNVQRKQWLHTLADQYDDFYQRSQNFFVLSIAKE